MNDKVFKIFIFIEWVLYVLFNIFVLLDMTGIDMYDTVLVEVRSLSAYNGAVPYIPNIIFIQY